jgi:preprotein translocase subunit SecG
MTTILLVIHLMVAVAMIVLVLLQRSEGGALGIGGGGGDGLMSARGLGNTLTRATAILAGVFFLTSIGLTVLGTMENKTSVLDGVIENQGNSPTGPLAPAPALPDVRLPTPE